MPSSAIPKIIHRIWAGDDFLPYRLRRFGDTWAEHHPDWEIRLWTPADLNDLHMVNRKLYDAAETMAPNDWLRWRADIARLEILYTFGGVYVDMDTECLRPFDPLLQHSCWFAESPNAPGHATQAVCACRPEHPFLAHLLKSLPSSAQRYRNKRINHRVGSRFVDREVRRVGTDVNVFPWTWFAGQSISQRDRGDKPDLSASYCWHRYDNTARHGDAGKQIEAFRAAADILDSVGVSWWLASGLLLGHVRDGRILGWDRDVDLGIWPEDFPVVRQAFRKAGYRALRDRESQFQPQHPNGTKIDIHTHYRDDVSNTVYKLHGKRENIRMDHPAHLFDGMQETIFYLKRCLIPSPPEQYLEVMYGHDWMTPKREWQWDSSPRNITKLSAPPSRRRRR